MSLLVSNNVRRLRARLLATRLLLRGRPCRRCGCSRSVSRPRCRARFSSRGRRFLAGRSGLHRTLRATAHPRLSPAERAPTGASGVAVQLLSDIDGEVCELYGVWWTFEKNGVPSRGVVPSTFVIDRNRIEIIHLYYFIWPDWMSHGSCIFCKLMFSDDVNVFNAVNQR